jgi:hypothetical protein
MAALNFKRRYFLFILIEKYFTHYRILQIANNPLQANKRRKHLGVLLIAICSVVKNNRRITIAVINVQTILPHQMPLPQLLHLLA